MRKLIVNSLGEIIDRAQERNKKTWGLLEIAQLTSEERKFVAAMDARQSVSQNGQFNVWGYINSRGKPVIRLDIEFREHAGLKKWWTAFRRYMINNVGLRVELMAETKEDNIVYRQVACWLDVTKLTLPEIRCAQRRIRNAVMLFWPLAGVSVS